MEVNKHFLGLGLTDGIKDNTLEFIKKLFNIVWGKG
jgi:hypothetical protein